MVGIGIDERDFRVVCELASEDQGRRALSRSAFCVGKDDGWHRRSCAELSLILVN